MGDAGLKVVHEAADRVGELGPVVGDDAYDRGWKSPVEVPRFFLHATHLAFTHPTTGEHLSFDAPLPPDLAAVLDRLGG